MELPRDERELQALAAFAEQAPDVRFGQFSAKLMS
jgi:hypothetical protein